MKRLFLIVLMVFGSLLFYYVLGLNAVKLILIFLSQILPENIRTNQVVLLFITSFISPVIAACLTYSILSKYSLKRWSDKNLSKEDATKILKTTIIIASFFVAVANLYIK